MAISDCFDGDGPGWSDFADKPILEGGQLYLLILKQTLFISHLYLDLYQNNTSILIQLYLICKPKFFVHGFSSKKRGMLLTSTTSMVVKHDASHWLLGYGPEMEPLASGKLI